MYHMALEKVSVVNHELPHVLVVDVHYGVQHVPEMRAITCNRFQVRIVDVRNGVQHVPEMPESTCNRDLLKTIKINNY